MVFIAMLMVSTPILVMLFFVFYKSWLIIAQKNKKPELPNYTNNTVHQGTSFSQPIKYADDTEDEITAVITAAVNIYLKQTI